MKSSEINKGVLYKVKNIKSDKPLFMNYGIMEEILLKIIDKSPDQETVYIEIMGFNRKIAISSDMLDKLILEKVEEKI
ncbi:MAG: hypothetical protein ACK4GR_05925 [bacterium]